MKVNFHSYTPQIHRARPQAQKPAVSFGTNFREYECNGKTFRNTTRLFKEGINWDKFPLQLEDRFKGKERVYIISHACSDGSEAYTIAMMLLEKLGPERAKKFLPVIARDINGYIIERADSGYIRLDDNDVKELQRRDIYEKYFSKTDFDLEIDDDDTMRETTTHKVNDELVKLVDFDTGDAFSDLDKLDNPSRTVFLFRNALYLLDKSQQRAFLNKASRRLNGDSLLVVGAFDGASRDAIGVHTYLSTATRLVPVGPGGFTNMYCKDYSAYRLPELPQ